MLNAASLQSQLVRAQSLQQAGRLAEAWTVVAPLRVGIERHGQALRLYALIAQGAGQIDPAVDALQRIIALERDPPEIIGALADLLGNAGRHAEALVHWTRLAALQPGIAEAHLNRAIAAADAGQPSVALQASDQGLGHFPGHPRLLATRAMALKNLGRLDEAVAGFEQAIAADPNRALTRHNQAVTLRAASRFDEACEAYAESQRLGMAGAQFHANWAAAALEAGRIDDARDQYQQALATEPGHAESARALTRLLIEYRGGEAAFAHYEDAADKSRLPQQWIDFANALLANRRHGEARDVAARALARFPDHPALAAIQAYADGLEGGDPGTALERIELIARDGPAPPPAWLALLALRDGQPARSAGYCEQMTALDPNDQNGWSMLSVAWRQLGDQREHWLCDYDGLVLVTDVTSVDGHDGAGAYAAEVAASLDPLHRALSAPGDQSLRGGTQTSGALFDRPGPAIARFRRSIIAAATQATAGLPADPSHPFLSRRTDGVRVVGSWSVRLQGGGHHVSHYHQEGWMSSAYYARLPVQSDTAQGAHEGWIQFGVPPAIFNVDLPPRRIVQPVPGRLVLFPSYLLHGTVPFAAGDRLTAAFDFQPV